MGDELVGNVASFALTSFYFKMSSLELHFHFEKHLFVTTDISNSWKKCSICKSEMQRDGQSCFLICKCVVNV